MGDPPAGGSINHQPSPINRPPLAGLRVVDLSRVLAGPYCTMLLGDLGADVVKVELPGLGDDTRRFGPPFIGGESAYFLAINRNKRSLTLNLKNPRGQDVLRRLLAGADVLIENFRPGTLDELGLGWRHLHAEYPRLVQCSISAFGSRGPRKDQPGYDYAIQASGGIMSITGEPDGQPMKVPVAIVDITAGLYALVAILAALRARDRDGLGQLVEVSLFQSQLAWLINVASGYLVSGDQPTRHGNAHPNIVPYQTFRCVDGHVVVACANDAQFRGLCSALDLSGLADDPRFCSNPGRVSHRDVLVPLLAEAMTSLTRGELLAALAAANVPAAPINTVPEALADPQAAALAAILHIPHPTVGDLPLVRWPFDLSGTPATLWRAPPLLGQHTDRILAELGLSTAEVAVLRAEGAV